MIKYKTHNDDIKLDINGTHLITCIDVSYKKLKRVFGKPIKNPDGYKVDAQWIIKFEDGTLATVYNYKSGKSYLGKEGEPVTKIRDWHIGGVKDEAKINVLEALIQY